MVEDPVCGMEVSMETVSESSEYQGQIYYFCSPGCKEAFENDPEQYLFPDEENSH